MKLDVKVSTRIRMLARGCDGTPHPRNSFRRPPRNELLSTGIKTNDADFDCNKSASCTLAASVSRELTFTPKSHGSSPLSIAVRTLPCLATI